jgi:hypothetical protein
MSIGRLLILGSAFYAGSSTKTDARTLQNDIELVLDNALRYNQKDTPLWRLANRIKTQVPIIFDQFHPQENPSLPGDLQLALPFLEALFSREQIEDINPFELSVDPIESLFNYELGVEKEKPEPPPPTPPPPPPPRKPRAPKKGKRVRPPRDYVAERLKRKAKLQAEKEEAAAAAAAGIVEEPQHFLPRTRGEAARLAEVGAAEAAATTPIASETAPGGAGGDDEPVAKRKKPRGEANVSTPAPIQTQPVSSDLDLVDSVSKEESFKRFNDGWILPPSARSNSTGGATSTEPPSPTKPTASTSRAASNSKENKKGSGTSKNKRKREPTVGTKPKRERNRSRKKTSQPVEPAKKTAVDSELSELSEISSEDEAAEEDQDEEDADGESDGQPPEDTELEAEEVEEEEEEDYDANSPEAQAVKHLKLKPGQTLEGGTLGESLPSLIKDRPAHVRISVWAKMGEHHLVE